MDAKLSKFQTFELGQTIWAIGVLSADLSHFGVASSSELSCDL